MVVILDAGAFLAVEQQDRTVGSLLKRSTKPITSAAVVAQVWRGGGRQARIARTLTAVDIRELDDAMGRRIGELLAASRTRDVVDAHVALLVRNGDVVLTSDPDDLRRLLNTRGIRAAIRRV